MSSVHKFIAACWESGRLVTNVNTRSKFEEILMSHQEMGPMVPTQAGAPGNMPRRATHT